MIVLFLGAFTGVSEEMVEKIFPGGKPPEPPVFIGPCVRQSYLILDPPLLKVLFILTRCSRRFR